MKTLFLILILFLLTYCSKAPNNPVLIESKLPPGGVITAVLCNDSGYAMHPGAFVLSLNYRTGRNADTISDGLWYVHNYLVGDTTENWYHYPCAEASSGEGAVYVYADHALQQSSTFPAFQTWFKKNMIKWMNGHECPTCNSIDVQPVLNDTSFVRVHCIM